MICIDSAYLGDGVRNFSPKNVFELKQFLYALFLLGQSFQMSNGPSIAPIPKIYFLFWVWVNILEISVLMLEIYAQNFAIFMNELLRDMLSYL